MLSCNFESVKSALNPGSRFIMFIVDANFCSFLAANAKLVFVREQIRVSLSQLFLCGIQHDFLWLFELVRSFCFLDRHQSHNLLLGICAGGRYIIHPKVDKIVTCWFRFLYAFRSMKKQVKRSWKWNRSTMRYGSLSMINEMMSSNPFLISGWLQ